MLQISSSYMSLCVVAFGHTLITIDSKDFNTQYNISLYNYHIVALTEVLSRVVQTQPFLH